MSRFKKSWLITAVLLVVIGLFLFIGSFAALDFDFGNLGTQKYEEKTYEVSGDFDKISIRITTSKPLLVPYDGKECKVECLKEEKTEYTVAVKDRTLVIDTVDHARWYDRIGFSFDRSAMTVYLPQSTYDSLTVDTATGDVELTGDIAFGDLKITAATANILCHAPVSGVMDIRTKTGNMEIRQSLTREMNLATGTGIVRVNSAAVEKSVTVDSSTGKIQLTDVTCGNLTVESNTGHILLERVTVREHLQAHNSTGHVKLDRSDAGTLFIRTSTGDITGTLRSPKIFVTKTSTGDVDVPSGGEGGRCELTTSTGDIEISIRD